MIDEENEVVSKTVDQMDHQETDVDFKEASDDFLEEFPEDPEEDILYEDPEDGEETYEQDVEDPEEDAAEYVEEVPAEAGTILTDAAAMDYTPYFDSYSALLLMIIFFLGVGCGLISSGIMWRRVK